MNWSDIKDAVAKIAPVAGTLLGGPAGAAVGGLISSALGAENSPEAVMQELGNPESAIKLRELENTERQHFLQIQLSTLQAELADTQGARVAHVNSRMPAVITCALSFICAVMLYSLLFVPIPDANRDILVQSFGTVLGFWGASLAYWVGTTRSSSEKTKLLRQQQ